MSHPPRTVGRVDDERHPVVNAVAVLTALAAAVLCTWYTVIAFVGGTMPIIGYETEGGFFFGVVWLVFVDPIVVTVAWWASLLVMSPFIAGASALDAWRARQRRD